MNSNCKSASSAIFGSLIMAVTLLACDMAVRTVQAQPQGGAPKVLAAQEFRLTDSQGGTRATLACKPDGSPSLTFLDKTGKSRANFGLADSASSLVLYDTDGKVRARIAVEADGNMGLALHDKNGKLRAALHVRPDGSPAISLHDADGANRAALETQPDGSPALLLSNKEAKGGAALVVSPNGNPNIVFKNKDGDLLWSVPQQ